MSDENGKAELGASLSIQNISNHITHISHISILYPSENPPTFFKKARFIWRYKRLSRGVGWVCSSLSNEGINDGCPISVEGRKSHSVFIPQPTLESMLSKAPRREIQIEVQDPLWNSIYSDTFAIDWYDNGAINQA